jgi:dethiobiotin synthetase
MKGFFITGTDTDVGKTRIAAGLLHVLAARGHTTAAMKPVSAGCYNSTCDLHPDNMRNLRNDDALILQRHATLALPYEQVNPYAYAAAIAPHIAAAQTGHAIDILHIKKLFDDMAQRVDSVVVEGAGGWLVPINDHETMANVARALALPVILVVGMRLGCLSHALLSIESIAHHGLPLAGWVANTLNPEFTPLQHNIDALRARINAPLLGVVPHLENVDAESVGHHLNLAQ